MTALPPELGGPLPPEPASVPPPDLLAGPFLHGQSPLGQQPVNTQFAGIGGMENGIVEQCRKDAERVERAINAAQRIIPLKHSPGFQQFEQAIEDLRTHAKNEMVACTAGNEQLRILQGRCQAFGSILALMRNAERNIESLSQRLETIQSKAAANIREDGRVVPEPAVGGIL